MVAKNRTSEHSMKFFNLVCEQLADTEVSQFVDSFLGCYRDEFCDEEGNDTIPSIVLVVRKSSWSEFDDAVLKLLDFGN
ncbi:hypothetical protein L915_17411 [Phytophthora nicotianae]|uniref:Uncharacterized protein n=1 Tax=Phytophthora nicotianae TaxID=4792 RepID=W2G1M9_PHYNI|nr:hypothetical protein L915_17411 [Phytophthora nicotianae]ETL29544.1 hypothetical protein L916_17304 [Phytophthora nicotianae]